MSRQMSGLFHLYLKNRLVAKHRRLRQQVTPADDSASFWATWILTEIEARHVLIIFSGAVMQHRMFMRLQKSYKIGT